MGHSQNMPIEGGFMGPGGCQNQEECQNIVLKIQMNAPG